MDTSKKTAIESLHDIVDGLANILLKLSESQYPNEEISHFVGAVESLKEYFEEVDCEECPAGQDLGIGARPILPHLENN
ncbi:hypothetical protein NEPAR06_1301 [Nematocida parisii]|uniref:Uncharacterized protein n=1 Tax=Nematocida parisii (strain ERTm3) TaxID=935791 RepID=I3EEA8_NEMP3|nr:uncharacterized protein NEPG_02181 [Nematocida parisii ERTm1]EIJ87555.1 hypothetical protein NEQG_02102 [Nematocida parisii ERTm3]KAI5129071.1 hypothetical protein NEPAR08_1451 [Nematocida parisii]EIJ92782.1 hypothetical protein NEPG_02181 [Nematocida parisii ERTm1]KAI5129110.1 hypothetical protein NEPAR03_1514 [Nematocida parisii]KAI5141918.1 hypothetical protein NEPAR04_1286 [Nematocida parisii]|eukprot:XP_013060008.1 hypothetical protein NEPG_02181 [Nematocida parisii ERTm1]